MKLNAPPRLFAVGVATRLQILGLSEIGCATAELYELHPVDEWCSDETWRRYEVAKER
jgi:hypothetical protein